MCLLQTNITPRRVCVQLFTTRDPLGLLGSRQLVLSALHKRFFNSTVLLISETETLPNCHALKDATSLSPETLHSSVNDHLQERINERDAMSRNNFTPWRPFSDGSAHPREIRATSFSRCIQQNLAETTPNISHPQSNVYTKSPVALVSFFLLHPPPSPARLVSFSEAL